MILAHVRTAAVLLVGALAAACATFSRDDASLARVRVTADYATYHLDRVGLLPFRGADADTEPGRALQSSFGKALGAAARFEILALDVGDLEEVPASEPLRRGWTKPATVLALGRRYDLDAILIGTVSDVQSFAPQKLAIQLDLVATETGLPIWSVSLDLDAGEERVRSALEAWHESHRDGGENAESWELSLISPRRFAEFAAAEIASRLP